MTLEILDVRKNEIVATEFFMRSLQVSYLSLSLFRSIFLSHASQKHDKLAVMFDTLTGSDLSVKLQERLQSVGAERAAK